MTRDKVISLAGLSPRQVDYWASSGLIGPSVDRRLSPGRRVRLYEFQDVLELLIAAELRRKKISVQHIRQIVDHLRSRGYDRPLTQLSFAVLNREVYFKHDDGTWEGGLEPDQIVSTGYSTWSPCGIGSPKPLAATTATSAGWSVSAGCSGTSRSLAVPACLSRLWSATSHAAGRSPRSSSRFPVLTPADVEAVRDGAA